eukprot:259039_1
MRARAQQHAAVWLSGQSDPPYLPNRSPRWFPPPYQIPSYYSDIYNQTLHRSQFLPTRPPAHTTQPTVPVTVVTSSTAGSGTDVSGLPPPKSSAKSASSVLKGPVGRVIHHALSAFSRRGKFPPTIKNQPKAQISINSKPNDGKSTSSARTVNTPELILAETVLNSLKNLGSSPLQSAQPSSESSSGQNLARKRPVDESWSMPSVRVLRSKRRRSQNPEMFLNSPKEQSLIIKLFRCRICSKAYWKRNHLANHQRRHARHTYHCDECDLSFKSRHSLLGHKSASHGGVSQPTFLCIHCPRSFRSRQALGTHTSRIHSDSRLQKCPQ